MQRNSPFSLYSFVHRSVILVTLLTGLTALTSSCAPADVEPREATADKPDPRGREPKDPSELEEKVIYGTDSRRDYYAEPNVALRALADSTVALIEKSNLSVLGERVVINGARYGSENNLCANEPFAEQEAAAFCSGFLVASDIIVTAGHCMNLRQDCQDNAFVFGYAYRSQEGAPTEVPASDVYYCKSVIRSEAAPTGADFAVIQLDRPVMGRSPLAIRKEGTVQAGEDLIVIGHPSGLPVKIADGARVRSSDKPAFFVANLDTYAGNSGSAVFNARTLEVEGILVRGEQDFEWGPNRSCMVSRHCEDDGCLGEDVTKIAAALRYLPSSARMTPVQTR